MIQAGRTLVAGADANAQLVSSSQTIGGGFTDVPYHLDFPDDAVAVMWGRFGKYDFKLDMSTKEMTGSRHGDPASWRRLEAAAAPPQR